MARPCLTVALAGVALVVLPGSAGARAAEPAPVANATGAVTSLDLSVRADSLADDVTARWALLQRPDGLFPDPVAGVGEDYGTAMLGLAMARRGAERRDRTLVRSGLAAILAEVERPTNGAFEPLVLAEAYRWGTFHLAQTPGVDDLWPEAEARLRADLQSRPPAGEGTVAARCLADPNCWNNLKLVGALSGALLQRTGLTSTTPGALLADPALPGKIIQTAAATVPERTGASIERHGTVALTAGGLLSDPPRDPLAYHALSVALLGRLVDELGDAAPPAAIAALDRASRGLLLLAAPNGDLSWWGRGQAQAWVPAVTAEAAARAAKIAPARGRLRGRYLALTQAALDRLREDYGIGAWGFPLVPGATDAVSLRGRAVDAYATTRGYNGLAVDALDRAATILTTLRGTATSVPSRRTGSVRSPAQAGLLTLSRGGVWAAVAGRARAKEDARYGSGLLALQARGADERWTDRVPARPYSAARTATLAIKSGGERLPAAARVLPGRSSASVQLIGQWSRPGGGPIVDPGTRWTWSISPSGTVSASFALRRPRTVVVSALAGDGDEVREVPGGVVVTRADGTSVRYDVTVAGRRPVLSRRDRDLGGSAVDHAVRAVELTTRVNARTRVVLRIRPVGAPPLAGG